VGEAPTDRVNRSPPDRRRKCKHCRRDSQGVLWLTLGEPPARRFRPLADLAHSPALRELLERFVHHDLDPAILGTVEGPIADSGGHDVRNHNILAGMLAEVIADQPGKLATLEIAGVGTRRAGERSSVARCRAAGCGSPLRRAPDQPEAGAPVSRPWTIRPASSARFSKSSPLPVAGECQ